MNKSETNKIKPRYNERYRERIKKRPVTFLDN